METSKKIVSLIVTIFILSMAAAYTLPVLFDYVGNIALQIFQTTATLTGSVLIGYFGKAGFENYDKHRKLLGFEKDKDDEDEEGSNG